MISDEELLRRAELVTEMGGIMPHCRAFYSLSLRYSVTRAHQSFERYETSRIAGDTDEEQVSYVHEALGHSASLSRFFWPSGLGNKKFKKLRFARAKALRERFSIDDRSALKRRTLRDSLEHYDERLDKYCLSKDSGYFFPSAMIGDSDLADDPTGSIFRMVDPSKKIFVVMGEKHEFGLIQLEIKRLHDQQLLFNEDL